MHFKNVYYVIIMLWEESKKKTLIKIMNTMEFYMYLRSWKHHSLNNHMGQTNSHQ